jgi:general stress protein 26
MSETQNFELDMKRLGELIKDIEFAMLTTEDDDGTLRSRPMGTVQSEFDGTLYYFTYGTSHKVLEVKQHHQVNLSYARPDKQQYVSLSGTASLSRDRQKMEELWNPALKAWFPKGLDEPDIALLRVEVTKAEYWDSPPSGVVHAIGLLKAVVTGEKYKGGEDKQLDLQAGISKSAS